MCSRSSRITEPKIEQRPEQQLQLGRVRPARPGRTRRVRQRAPAVRWWSSRNASAISIRPTNTLAFRADKTRKFDDTADQLLDWLNRNGYAARPEAEGLAQDYIENTWIITAFKIAGQPAPGRRRPRAATASR